MATIKYVCVCVCVWGGVGGWGTQCVGVCWWIVQGVNLERYVLNYIDTWTYAYVHVIEVYLSAYMVVCDVYV